MGSSISAQPLTFRRPVTCVPRRPGGYAPSLLAKEEGNPLCYFNIRGSHSTSSGQTTITSRQMSWITMNWPMPR
jgi:hypothetical protein